MLSQKLRDCGVCGRRGAAFPTSVKANSQIEFLIANGPECEPLIHKDAELMLHFPAQVLGGMMSLMDAAGDRLGQYRSRRFQLLAECAQAFTSKYRRMPGLSSGRPAQPGAGPACRHPGERGK